MENDDQQLDTCWKQYDGAKDNFEANAEDLQEEMEGDRAVEQITDYIDD